MKEIDAKLYTSEGWCDDTSATIIIVEQMTDLTELDFGGMVASFPAEQPGRPRVSRLPKPDARRLMIMGAHAAKQTAERQSGKTFWVSLPDDLADSVRRVADLEQRPMVQVLRYLIYLGLKQYAAMVVSTNVFAPTPAPAPTPTPAPTSELS